MFQMRLPYAPSFECLNMMHTLTVHNAQPVKLPSLSDTTFKALRDGCIFIDKTRQASYLHRTPNVIEAILRPPGYGKSTLLTMLADLQDLRPDNEATIPPVIQSLFVKSNFPPSLSMVMLMDFATLDVRSLEASLKQLLVGTAVAFEEKYRQELQLEDPARLRTVLPFQALALLAVC